MQAVLVHSAAGGVGLQALSLLAAKHARVLGTVSSQSKAAALQQHIRGKPFLQQQLAAADVLVRSPLGNGARFKQDLSDWLLRQGISGFDIILDSVQGRYFQPGYDTLAPTGRVVVFGAADLTPPPGADLSIGLSLLNPVKWPAIARLVYGYLTRPKVDPLKLPGEMAAVQRRHEWARCSKMGQPAWHRHVHAEMLALAQGLSTGAQTCMLCYMEAECVASW